MAERAILEKGQSQEKLDICGPVCSESESKMTLRLQDLMTGRMLAVSKVIEKRVQWEIEKESFRVSFAELRTQQGRVQIFTLLQRQRKSFAPTLTLHKSQG